MRRTKTGPISVPEPWAWAERLSEAEEERLALAEMLEMERSRVAALQRDLKRQRAYSDHTYATLLATEAQLYRTEQECDDRLREEREEWEERLHSLNAGWSEDLMSALDQRDEALRLVEERDEELALLKREQAEHVVNWEKQANVHGRHMEEMSALRAEKVALYADMKGLVARMAEQEAELIALRSKNEALNRLLDSAEAQVDRLLNDLYFPYWWTQVPNIRAETAERKSD